MKVTIGIPFYNPGPYFEDAIRAVFAQSHKEWELILVDDGSTDGSLEFANSIDDPRVRVISDGENKGLPARLNLIAKEAKHPIIARMDADDLMSPDRLKKQLEFLNSNKDLDIVGTGLCSISDNLTPFGVRGPTEREQSKLSFENLLKGKCSIVHASIVGRKEWFIRNPYNPDAKLMEDYQLWLDSFLNNDFKIGFLPEYLYYYRECSNVSSSKAVLAYRNQLKLVKLKYKKHLSKAHWLRFKFSIFFKSTVVLLLNVFKLERLLLTFRNNANKKNNSKEFERVQSNIDCIKMVDIRIK